MEFGSKTETPQIKLCEATCFPPFSRLRSLCRSFGRLLFTSMYFHLYVYIFFSPRLPILAHHPSRFYQAKEVTSAERVCTKQKATHLSLT